MILKKNPDNGYYFLHNENDQPLLCPHQDLGNEVQLIESKLQGQQPKQLISKRHMNCGNHCALFRWSQTAAPKYADQLCASKSIIRIDKVEQ
jgi:hypothetical protein